MVQDDDGKHLFSVIATNQCQPHQILKTKEMPRFGRLSVLGLSAYVGNLAVSLLRAGMAGGAGYLVQRRLRQAPALAALFGPRLWSVRVLVLLGKTGPKIHRAVAKIATGTNPADNYWRQGNMLGAVALDNGIIWRVVSGSGASQSTNHLHPDTGCPILGTKIPDWARIQDLIRAAAPIFEGIRTQSWDIALAEHGPILLEVNFGGDLNLAQIATNAGVLDAAYTSHVEDPGYLVR